MSSDRGLHVGEDSLSAVFESICLSLDCMEAGLVDSDSFRHAASNLARQKDQLRQWGIGLQINKEGHEDQSLRSHWPELEGEVAHGLYGIHGLFEQDRDGSAFARTGSPSAYAVVGIKKHPHIKQESQALTRWISPVPGFRGDQANFELFVERLAYFVQRLQNATEHLHGSSKSTARNTRKGKSSGKSKGFSIVDSSTHTTNTNSDTSASSSSSIAGGTPLPYGTDAYSATPASRPNCDVYEDTIVRDRARVFNGDMGVESRFAHKFARTQAYDDAWVVQGNVSTEFARSVLR